MLKYFYLVSDDIDDEEDTLMLSVKDQVICHRVIKHYTHNCPCQKVAPLYIGLLTTVFLFVVYTDTNTDHVIIKK